MKKNILCLSILIASFTTAFSQVKQKTPTKKATVKYTNYVDPLIGTGFHGHVFVGANVPFGAVQLGPTNISEGWDWSSGYHISDSTIVGFQHTHLSGTGIGDLGDISFMPTTGKLIVNRGRPGDLQDKNYYSLFDRKDELVKPGFYKVKLQRYNVGVRLTATNRVGFHEYTFPQSSKSHIIIDLAAGVGWDKATQTYIKKVNDNTIEGYRYSTGWAKDQRIYFTAAFSKPIKDFSVYDSLSVVNGIEATGRNLKGIISFASAKNEKIAVKVGISPVSCANALLNIKTEIPDWNFENVVAKADAAWNKELSKIAIKADSTTQLRKFYTALYHTMIAPSTFNDVNGDYRGVDKKVHQKASFQNLTTFSLWDTYRAIHPLYTIVQPTRVNDMINSMLAIYQQQGKLPVWHLMGNETNTMVGYSAVPVVADAYLKGFNGFDKNLAYEAVKVTSMKDDFGLKFVKERGYIPADSIKESVAMGLEYAIDDFGIAQMAKNRNNEADFQYYAKRAKNYQNYFDPETKFMRGRLAEKAWRTPFDPFQARHMQDDYTEGNSWQYTWLVPHDVDGLVKLQGGKEAFINKLDSLFILNKDMGKEASNDISGLIGQYAHGNEPSHHIAYLYAMVGQPYKTAEKVRYIMNNFYQDQPAGIIGNEDVGQMSAWYILSALGFYQVNPVDGKYIFGSPLVNEAVIKLPNQKTFEIKVVNNSSKNIYIKSLELNGKPLVENHLNYKDIMAGGKLIVNMSATRN